MHYLGCLLYCITTSTEVNISFILTTFLCAGYAQYIRFLYFESTVNNPVMHTFVYLLKDQQDASVEVTPRLVGSLNGLQVNL